MMPTVRWGVCSRPVVSLASAVLGCLLPGCTDEPAVVQPAETADDFAVIDGVRLANESNPYTQIPWYGDLWTCTWADDGHQYAIFGDGTGMKDRLPTLLMNEPDEMDELYEQVRPGWFRIRDPQDEAAAEWCEIYDGSRIYRQAPYTPAGLVRLEGNAPAFRQGDGPDQNIVSRHIPYGDLRAFEQMDKPSGLVAVGRRFYAHMHYPPGEPVCGYLAWSDDRGTTWRWADDSPWNETSPFRVTMFFNMGQAYRENRDGFLYGLGIGHETALDPPTLQPVFLLRVALHADHAASGRPPAAEHDPVLDYGAYEYFSGFDANGRPVWSSDPGRSEPLKGLQTLCQGSALYHSGLGRYLFLTGFVGEMPHSGEPHSGGPAGAVFEAPHPWGPWREAGRFPGGFIAGFLPKNADRDSVWYAAAGGGGVTYALNVARLQFDRREPRVEPAAYRVIDTRKVEQIIGDVDFETMKPTRQRTGTRFNLLHSDLGSSFQHKGKLWFLFGDSDPESPGWDPRHDDAVAWSDAESVEQFRLNFLTDESSGRGYRNLKIRGTVRGGSGPSDADIDLGTLNVPLDGISDGDRVFVWFTTDGARRSLVACSEDDFRSFRKVFDFGETHFVDVAVERARGPIPGLPASEENDQVLIFGSGNKQHHHVYLAAVSFQSLREADRSAVRFLKALTPHPDGWRLQWSDRESDAVPVFRIEHGEGPGVMSEVPHGWGFGEPLVHYNRVMKTWVATYNSARRTIRLRTAAQPWGPWSESVVLFDPAHDYGRGPAYGRCIGDGRTERLGGQGELYGPYVIEPFTRIEAGGRIRLSWLLSPWQPYTVLLMESTLQNAWSASESESARRSRRSGRGRPWRRQTTGSQPGS